MSVRSFRLDPTISPDLYLTKEFESLVEDDSKSCIRHNIGMIWSRERGQRFFIENGRLEIARSFIQRVKARSQIEQIKAIYTQSLLYFDADKIKSEKFAKGHSAAFCREFIVRFSHVSNRIFDRSEAISDGLEKLFLEYINEGPFNFKKYKESQEVVYLQGDSPDIKELKQDIIHVQLHELLNPGQGIKLLAAGSSGVYCGRDRYGNKRIVIKPYNEGSYAEFTPKLSTRFKIRLLTILKRIGFDFFRKTLIPDHEYLSEVYASYIASVIVKHAADLARVRKAAGDPLGKEEDEAKVKCDSLVPTTMLAVLGSDQFYGKRKIKVVSCQRWMEESDRDKRSAPEKQAPSWDLKWLFGLGFKLGVFYRPSQSTVRIARDDRRNEQQFDLLAIFDFLIGNQDRDTDNWKIIDERVVLFDHGLAFPIAHPKTRGLETRKQYLWTKLTNARRQFSKEACELIEHLYQNGLEVPPKFIRSGQGATLRDRLRILHLVATSGQDISVLGQYLTEEDFRKALKSLPETSPVDDQVRTKVRSEEADKSCNSSAPSILELACTIGEDDSPRSDLRSEEVPTPVVAASSAASASAP